MRPDVFVMSAAAHALLSQRPQPEGPERFIVCRPRAILKGFPWAPEELDRAFREFFDGAVWVTESEIRAELADIGLSVEEVERQLRRARGIHKLFGQPASWERTTRVGFRNVHRQEVIRKTELMGSGAHQRVYVLQCGDCGHQYGSSGCDIHGRRCHRCQDGPPGLPTENIFD